MLSPYLYRQQIVAAEVKGIHMSFKKFSSDLDAARKVDSHDKTKAVAAKDEPTAEPDKTPAEVTPASKS